MPPRLTRSVCTGGIIPPVQTLRVRRGGTSLMAGAQVQEKLEAYIRHDHLGLGAVLA